MPEKDPKGRLEKLRKEAIKTAVHYDVQAQIEREKEFEGKRPEFERLSARFGPDLAYDIHQGEFYPGMTMEMICEVYKIEYPLKDEFRTKHVKSKTIESNEYQSWKFDDQTYFYFTDEVLIAVETEMKGFYENMRNNFYIKEQIYYSEYVDHSFIDSYYTGSHFNKNPGFYLNKKEKVTTLSLNKGYNRYLYEKPSLDSSYNLINCIQPEKYEFLAWHNQMHIFSYLEGKISARKLMDQFFNCIDLENQLNEDDYVELISLNHSNKYFRNELMKIVSKYLDWGYYSEVQIRKFLIDSTFRSSEIIKFHILLYDLYCYGYDFLRKFSAIALNYATDFRDYEKWEVLPVQKKNRGIQLAYSLGKSEALKILNSLDEGNLKLIYNKETNRYGYIDNVEGRIHFVNENLPDSEFWLKPTI